MRLSFCSGSPPHTRGQEIFILMEICQFRITPAHAGTRECARSGTAETADHPRTRGDKRKILPMLVHMKGSPPHTRGQGDTSISAKKAGRITPAHAGTSRPRAVCRERQWDHPRTRGDKTTLPVFRLRMVRDHPRTRGDKIAQYLVQERSIGSPPHTRGQVSGFVQRVLLLGDHPRTRGDKPQQKTVPAAKPGSPPHTRGQVICVIILYRTCWDHPRTRGDKSVICAHLFHQDGSPPHTRGQAIRIRNPLDSNRITPAHAGTRRGITFSNRASKDHPRTRGDKLYHNYR